MANYWLAVGPLENWDTAFEQKNIWGLTERQKHIWNKLAEKDVVLFYATKPLSGMFGYGIIQTTFRQSEPLWPQEVAEGKVMWPHRFEFNVEYCLPRDEWEERKVTSDTLKLKAGMGFHSLDADFARQLIAQLQPVEEVTLSSHDEIKRKLVEIGKIQGYTSESEYPFDLGRLDAVWRRLANSVPTYVFEVQVGGDIYHAIAKLKHAYDLWNSQIFLVASKSDSAKVNNLMSGSFHEINDRMKFIELEKIEELYKRKKAYYDFEKELGIK